MNSALFTDRQISVVTPTLRRPREVKELLENLALQTLLPAEVILVDGAPDDETDTELSVAEIRNRFPFQINYIRHQGGTGVQRNAGIDIARGNFIAFIDDDVRLDVNFFGNLMDVLAGDEKECIGGVVGFRVNQHFSLEESRRWRWYKRLGLLSVYEPGRYDFKCGYPVNNSLQSPFTGTRRVDFMSTACALWRREVFDAGLRFDPFFKDYGVLEDAHFSLRAGHHWALLQSGDAYCEELNSPNGRVGRCLIGYKCVVNYYFVFQDIVGTLSLARKMRFWRFQAFELARIASSALRRRSWGDVLDIVGRLNGISTILVSRNKIRRDY